MHPPTSMLLRSRLRASASHMPLALKGDWLALTQARNSGARSARRRASASSTTAPSDAAASAAGWSERRA